MREQLLSFLEYIKEEKNFSDNTVVSYKHDIESFMEYINNIGISLKDCKPIHVEEYIKTLYDNGRTNSTIARNVASIRCFFKYMFTKGLISTDSEINLKMPKAEKKIKRETLPPEIFDKILFQVPNSTSGRRDKAMLSLLSCTRISISELVSIDIDSFNKKTREIKLKSGIVILPYNAFAYLLDYLDNSRKLLLLNKSPVKTLFLNCNGNPLSRQGFWKTVKKYIKMAKIGDSVTLQNLKSLKL